MEPINSVSTCPPACKVTLSPALQGLLLATLLLVTGCTTLPDGSRWGEEAFASLDTQTITRAARDAFFHPNTLIPLAGAALFAIDDFDHKASDWAVKHTPIFGDEEDARDASDSLETALAIEALATALATPGGDDPERWACAKLKGIAVEATAVAATLATTGILKEAADRRRPDSSNDDSFPSGHASGSFAYATLANRNLDRIDMPPPFRTGLQIGNVVLAGGVAWARVEGRRHYPSDVLFGAALGHFLAAFIHDALMNLPDDNAPELATFTTEGGAGLQLALRF